jgi:Flp pilus assembly CpaE family ATPase
MTLAGLRDGIRQLGLAQQVAPQARIFVVADRVVGKDGSLSKAEFEKALGHALDIVLPEEQKAVQAAATSGKPLAATAKNSRVVAQLRDLVKQIYSTEEASAKKPFWRLRGKSKK